MRSSQAPKLQPSTRAQAMLKPIAHQTLSTSVVTCGVKYRPKAVAMIHWAVLRNGPKLRVGQPKMEAADVATSGPIIQGIGVRNCTHNSAAAKASSSVSATRTGKVEVM